MKSMRELIKLMEGVAQVPHIGKQESTYLSEEVDSDSVRELANKLSAGEISYEEFKEALDGLEQTDYSMRQGEMGMQGDDTPAGNRAWDRDRGDHQDGGSTDPWGDAMDGWEGDDDDDYEDEELTEKSTSEKQARFMAAAAHDPKFAKKVGMDTGVAKEFNKADTGTKQLSNAMKHKTEEGIDMDDQISVGDTDGSDNVDQAVTRFMELINSFVDPNEAFDTVMKEMGQNELTPEEKLAISDAMVNAYRAESDGTGDEDGPMMGNYNGADSGDGFGPSYDNERSGFEEEIHIDNGYSDINDADGNDFFPDGADSPVITDVGPSGARQGDNPEQKKMQVAEVHKELVYGYRNYLNESSTKKKS